MLRLLEFLALLPTAIFAGAALYINVVEHPARMSLDTRSAASEWAPSYRRATWMQAPLAALGLLGGLGAWAAGAGLAWAAGAVLIGAVIPVTLIVIFPTNQRLLAPDRDLASAETRALLERWARLHALRSSLSLVATLIYLWAALSG